MGQLEMKTIKQAWLDYQKKVLPKDAPPIQVRECQTAFYAGALVAKQKIISISEEDVSEEVGAMMMIDVHNEINNFFKEVRL
jgi:hypothetical protein